MNKAFQRFFLILFPLSLMGLALFLIKKQNSIQISEKLPCETPLALSFFQKTHSAKSPDQKKNFTLKRSYLLSEKQFLNQLALVRSLPFKPFFFVLPLALNKEENWIITEKVFFISSTGERREISQLSFKDIQKFHKGFKILSLDQALSKVPPQSSFLLQILGSNREKIIKNLWKITQKIQGGLYLSSPDEKLLKALINLRSEFLKAEMTPSQSKPSALNKLERPFKIIHSFKALIRSQILSFLPLKSFLADGVWVPSYISNIAFDSLIQKKNQRIFIEKDPPYSPEDLKKAGRSYIFISSKPELSSVKNKKTCFK